MLGSRYGPLPVGCILLLAIMVSPRVKAMDLKYAVEVRDKVAAHDPVYAAAMERLVEAADAEVTKGPWSVTDKKVPAPSKDLRDYVSLAPYFWPDPSKPDGLPYISRDGRVYPGSRSGDNADRPRLEEMFTAVRTLNVAYYMTGKSEYARRSAQVLRIFFLDKRTGMNPNLKFAQGVRGGVSGRSYGIIDFNSLPDVIFCTGFRPANSGRKNPRPGTITGHGSMRPPAASPILSVIPSSSGNWRRRARPGSAVKSSKMEASRLNWQEPRAGATAFLP